MYRLEYNDVLCRPALSQLSRPFARRLARSERRLREFAGTGRRPANPGILAPKSVRLVRSPIQPNEEESRYG